MKSLLNTIALLGVLAIGLPAFGADTPRPGTVNYIEGSVNLDGKQLNPRDIGNIEMNAGDQLETTAGKAEILLTPGVFLRVGENSSITMVKPEIVPTVVQLNSGKAAVEVDQISDQNDLQVVVDGVLTHLAKKGYYEFDANPASALVYKGEAVVDLGDNKYQKIKGNHEMALVQGAIGKSQKFDRKDAKNSLYKWSDLRSQYLAEANSQLAGDYAGAAGFYPGWYWSPYSYGYTFIGAGPLFSPFGFGFYPPWWGGYYGGYYGVPIYGGGYRHFHGGVYHGGGYRGGYHGGGFHGGGGGFHGGGGHGGRR